MPKLDLASLTVLEFRRALATGDPHMTVLEAIEAHRRGQADALEREQRDARYRAFVDARAARRAAADDDAINEALAELERTVALQGNTSGIRKYRPLPGPIATPGRRHEVSQEAAIEAGGAFDARYPLLNVEEWTDAGEPDVYEDKTAAAIVRRTANRIKAAVIA
jgi:hypothetical protein